MSKYRYLEKFALVVWVVRSALCEGVSGGLVWLPQELQ